MAAKTILLDLDGTVWDSRPWYADNLAEFSGVASSEIKTKLAGGANLVHLAGECGVSKRQLIVAATENSGSLRLYEGVRETLSRLHSRGIPIGIVSKPTGLARQSSGRIMWNLTVRCNGGDPRPGMPAKPNPRGLFKVLELMGTVV